MTLDPSIPARLTVVALLLSAASGCGAIAADLPKKAVPSAISSGLASMEDPASRQKMLRFVESPEVKAMRRELIAGSVDEVVRDGTRGVMREALRPENERDVEVVVERMARAGVRGLSEAEISAAFASALTSELGPALQTVARQNMGPAIADVLDEKDVHRALGATAHAVGRELVLGIHDGLQDVQAENPPGYRSLFARIGSFASSGATVANALTWVFGALLLLLGAWIVKLLVQATKYRATNARLLREAAEGASRRLRGGKLRLALARRRQRSGSVGATNSPMTAGGEQIRATT